MLRIFSYVYFHLYIFFTEMFIQIFLPIFKNELFVLLLYCKSSLYIL